MVSILISVINNQISKFCLLPYSGNCQSAGTGGGHTEHRLAARICPQELDWYISLSLVVCLIIESDMTLLGLNETFPHYTVNYSVIAIIFECCFHAFS